MTHHIQPPLLFLLCAATVLTACRTYEVYRGARVPRPAPSMRSGQPMENLVEFGLTHQSVADTRAPELGDESAGVHIPRHQGRAELRFRVPRTSFDIIVRHERGLESGSYSLAKGSPTPDGDATGIGLALYYSAAIEDTPWRIGISAEYLAYLIPYVEYRICVDNCPTPFVVQNHEIAGRSVGSLSVIPSYRVGENLAVFGGVSARNHPTIPRTGIEGDIDLGQEVQGGPLNVSLAGGLEYTHESGLRASLQVYQTITGSPVSYAPTVGASVIIPLYRGPKRTSGFAPPPAATPPPI